MGSAAGPAVGGLGAGFLLGDLIAGKTKGINPTPPPPPKAIPMLGDQNPELTAQQKAKKLASMKYGFASTIASQMKAPIDQPLPITGGKTLLGQ